MSCRSISIVSIAFIIQFELSAQVSWQKVNSPNEDITCMDVGSNNIIYAGTPTYGVFKSLNEGDNWSNVSSGLPDSTVRALEISSDGKVFIGTGTHGVYQLITSSWTAANNGLPASNLLVVDFEAGANGNMYMMTSTGSVFQWNGSMWMDITYNLPPLGKCLGSSQYGILYAGVFNSGVYKFDGVNTWTSVGNAMPNSFVTRMAISTADTIIAVCNSNNVFRCSLNGGNWEVSNSGLPSINMSCIAVDAFNNIFIGSQAAHGALYKSGNNGGTWSLVSNDLKTTVFQSLAVSPSNKIFAGASGVFRSVDEGQTWVDLNKGMEAPRIMLSFKCARNGTFYIGNKLGIWRSTDSGMTWQLRNMGISHYNVLQIMETATGNLLMHAYNNVPKGAVYRSVNQGETWSLVAANGCDFYTKIKQHKTDTIWVSSRFSGATSLSFSTDDGLNWQNNPLMISAIWDIDLTKDRTLFLGSESEGVSRSDNGGQTFQLGVGNSTSWYGNVIEVERDENGFVFAGGDWWNNILWFSKPEENGNFWTKFTDSDLMVKGAQDLVFDLNNNAYLACENNGLRMAFNASWDAGTNWIACNSGLPSPNANLLELGFDTTGYLYTVSSATNGHNAGLFKTISPVQPSQSSVFRFIGNGLWSNVANWAYNHKPPVILSGNKIVIIDHVANGECQLDEPLQVSGGVKFKIYPGKKLRL